MKRIIELSQTSAQQFREFLIRMETSGEGFSEERYARFLRMQYHLTKGVQRPFFSCAAHPDMVHRLELRKFLLDFGIEEEQHYKIAEKDLSNMGRTPGTRPFEVTLWWSYFDTVVIDRPFIRLGATCILENISSKSADVIDRLLSKATYINARNTKFLQIHRHENDNPHGAQILKALDTASLEERHFQDLIEGATNAHKLYMKMFEWVVTGETFGLVEEPLQFKKAA